MLVSLPAPLPSLKRERNLLGTAYDWESNARPASFDDVRRRHQSLPANQLARVAAQYLRQQQQGGGGGGGGDGSVEGGSSSGTAIVVLENAPSLSAPGAPRSLLSRVEPFGHDREANEVCISACCVSVSPSFSNASKRVGSLNLSTALLARCTSVAATIHRRLVSPRRGCVVICACVPLSVGGFPHRSNKQEPM